MLEYINFSSVPAFILIFMRITGFFVALPLFSYRNMPSVFKVGISFFLAWLMYYTVPIPEIIVDETFILLVFKEVAVGLFVGLIAYIMLTAIQLAGGLIDFQMGFAIANVIDPQTNAQVPLMGQYFYTFALLLILSVNGHHLLIDGIFYSYQSIPMDQFPLFGDQTVVEFVIQSFSQMFIIAFLMSIPIVGCLFLVDVALGIVARTVPQLNVFVVGLPLKILVGLLVLFVSMTIYIGLIKNLFAITLEIMQGLMQLLGGL